MSAVSRAHSRAPSLGSKKEIGSSAPAPIAGDDPIDPSAPVIKASDMPPHMQQHATSLAEKAIADTSTSTSIPSTSLHNTVARVVKKEFDAAYGGVWHCVVGRNFGSFVVHDTAGFVYFYPRTCRSAPLQERHAVSGSRPVHQRCDSHAGGTAATDRPPVYERKTRAQCRARCVHSDHA